MSTDEPGKLADEAMFGAAHPAPPDIDLPPVEFIVKLEGGEELTFPGEWGWPRAELPGTTVEIVCRGSILLEPGTTVVQTDYRVHGKRHRINRVRHEAVEYPVSRYGVTISPHAEGVTDGNA